MGKGHYSQLHSVSSGLSDLSDGKPLDYSDRLNAPMRRRQPISEILNQKMKDTGVKAADIVRRSDIKKSTLQDILDGDTDNPGIFTLEKIALGMNVSPEQLLADILGSRADDPAFKGSQFAILLDIYRSMSPGQREKADARVSDLSLVFQHIKSLPK